MAELIVEDGTIVPDANSYATIAEADFYFEKRLHTQTWDNATDEDKAKALMWATRLLDEQVSWSGILVDANQPLAWPRSGFWNRYDNLYEGENYEGPIIVSDWSQQIPYWLRDAVSEFALHLLAEDRTLETNRDLIGLSRIKLDSVEIETDRAQAMTLSKPIIPQSVWSIIRPYGRSYSRKRRLVRS